MAAQQRVLERRQHRVLVAEHARRKSGSPARSRASRFARSSSRTLRGDQPEARSSASVRGAGRLDRHAAASRLVAWASACRGSRRVRISMRRWMISSLPAVVDAQRPARRAARAIARRWSRRCAPRVAGWLDRKVGTCGPPSRLQRLEEADEAVRVPARARHRVHREGVGLHLRLAAEGVQYAVARQPAAELRPRSRRARRRRSRPPSTPTWYRMLGVALAVVVLARRGGTRRARSRGRSRRPARSTLRAARMVPVFT